jgi:hypothetical protein
VVTRDAPCLSLLVLTEDGAEGGCDTIAALVKKMLLLIDGACKTHRIEFKPQGEDASRAMRANLWKSTEPRDYAKIVLLGRAIAAKLLEQDEAGQTGFGFVLFHFDGDRSWSERASSENLEKFEVFVRQYVEQSVDTALRRQKVIAANIEREKAAAMLRLRRLTPFYSIEAWLYQNTAEARRRCANACGRHLERIAAWEADRGLLDELDKPKKQLCLGADHNLGLATSGFPAEDAFKAEKSYFAAVMNLLECVDLSAALERTRA